jgi:hypothetical protein
MYETRHQPLLTRQQFTRRLWWHVLVAMSLLVVSLAAGMAGYVSFEHMSGIDAFLNASMLLAGMGPVDMPHSDAGKLFAGCYAIYCGVVFLITAGLLFVPILHRLMHRIHWSETL